MNTSTTGSNGVKSPDSGAGSEPHAVVHPEEVTPHPPIDRRAWIAATAYAFAANRGFEPGHELEDWLKAEKQVQFEIVGEGRTF
jgi:hypothetical protein